MPSSTNYRNERIDLRVSADVKSLLARAAAYSGMSLSSFLVSVARDRAKELVAEHETLTLSRREWNAFLTALDEHDKSRPHLEAAARRYNERRSGHDVD